jgi:hypothetical protein
VQNQDGSLTFSAPSSPEARERLEGFLGKEFDRLVNEDGGRLSMTLNPDLLATFTTRFSDASVLKAVKDRTAG